MLRRSVRDPERSRWSAEDMSSPDLTVSPMPPEFTPETSVHVSHPHREVSGAQGPHEHTHTSTKSIRANVAPDIRLGIACMAKKIHSPTMRAFIAKFESFGFTVVQFEESMLLHAPVEDWPNVDCAIMFFSGGFPLKKACEYYHHHKRDTYFLTEPESQVVLLDRRDFYQALSHNSIPLPPNHMFCSRDGYRGQPESTLEEGEDHIVVDGRRLDKPFVEKPVDAEDHRVHIYYHSSQGGGCRKMFRKVKNQSSEFDPDYNRVRRDGSFLYESFVPAHGKSDIKCYTVGPNFVHAERRKAPSADGVVDRDARGKEVRESVNLTPTELMVARKIIKVFRQMVCGFDILRVSDTEFYVCDVNGWSFVKNNDAYVTQAASIMKDIFLDEVGRRGLHRIFKRTATVRELVGVVGVFRHADRTPKQKLKLTVASSRLLDCAFDGQRNVKSEVVFKGEHPKLADLDVILKEEIIAETQASDSTDAGFSDTRRSRLEVLNLMSEVLSRRHEGLKMQVKPKKHSAQGDVIEAQLVCKWGGWLTAAGERQSQNVGQHFVERVFGNECGPAYLRDVTVTTNNERRVMATARNFIEHVMPSSAPITVDEPLLGDNSAAKDHLAALQERVKAVLMSDDPGGRLSPDEPMLPGMENVLTNFVLVESERTPLRAMRRLHELMMELVHHLHHHWQDESAPLYRDEPLLLLRQRWANLLRSFVVRGPVDLEGSRTFDISDLEYDVTKLTDVFDYVSYDVCYNQRAFSPVDLYPLFTLAQSLSAVTSEAEAGMDGKSKFLTGSLIGAPLLTRIYQDLVAITMGDVPRTRLYFTSASHVNALRHLVYNCECADFHHIATPLELHFLSHFVFKVYRYPPTPTASHSHPRSAGEAGLADDTVGVSLDSGGSASMSPIGPIPPPALHTAAGGGSESSGSSLQGPDAAISNSSLAQPMLPPRNHPPSATSGVPTTTMMMTTGSSFQIEVHFSTGVDKNMFGIVQGHHMNYGAVSPMIRINNNLAFAQFREIVLECQRRFTSTAPKSDVKLETPAKVHSTPVSSTPRGATITPTSHHRRRKGSGLFPTVVPSPSKES